MGLCWPKQESQPRKEKNKNVQQVDIVKVKLKQARDKINNFISAKNRDIDHIDAQLKEKIPKYQETGNKKELVPLLKAKKDLQTLVDNGRVRVRLINDKLAEVQMQQINKQTVDVLEDSNKYIKQVQNEMEEKDWRGILDEAKQKYEVQWPEQEDMNEDPTFQALWNEIGGNKIPQKKQVNVSVPQTQVQTHQQKPKEMLA